MLCFLPLIIGGAPSERINKVMQRFLGKAAGAAGIIALLTLLSRLAGLIRKLAQSWAVSDSAVAAAYDTANTLPNVLFEVAAGGMLAGAVIPLISRYIAQGDYNSLRQSASALFTWILLAGTTVALAVIIGAPQLAQLLFGADTSPHILALAAALLRMFALQIPLYGLSVVCTGVLHAHKKFTLPALAPLLSSLVVIAVFSFYAYRIGPEVPPEQVPHNALLLLGWGTTAGVAAFSLPQLIPVQKIVKLRFTLHFPPGAARMAFRLGLAGLGALLAQQLAILTIMYTANTAGGVGAYSAFSYAYVIFMVPYAVLAVPVATVAFPRISLAVQKNSQVELLDLIARSTRLVLTMGMVSAALIIALARPAKIVLEVGRDISGLEQALVALAIGVIGFSLLYHGARILYALEEGKKVILINSLAWGGVCLLVVLGKIFGIAGRIPTLQAIGVAMSVGLSGGAFLVIFTLRRLLGEKAVTGLRKIFAGELLFLVPATILGRQFTHYLLEMGNNSEISAFLAAGIVGILLLAVGAVPYFFLERCKKEK